MLQFLQHSYSFRILENVPLNSVIGTLLINRPNDRRVKYRLIIFRKIFFSHFKIEKSKNLTNYSTGAKSLRRTPKSGTVFLLLKFSYLYTAVISNALSFYRSKINFKPSNLLCTGTNFFGQVQIVLVGSKSFWSSSN